MRRPPFQPAVVPALLLCPLLLLGPGAAALAEELTLEWILSPETSRALATARCLWLPDETLLVDDPRRPETERTLERLDPRSLERRPAVDAAKALDGLGGHLGKEKSPKRLGLPSAVAPGGRTLLYELEGDLFLVDLETAAARRLTNTEAPERSPRFSPDGRHLAYVRDNDLHAAEAATGREKRLTRDGSETCLNGTLSWVYWEEIMDRRDEAFWWSPDSGALLYLQTDDSPVSRYPLVDHEPEVPRVRWQRYPKAGGANPVVRAGIQDLEGGPSRWIDLGAPAPEYIARAAWLPDGSRAALETLNRSQDRLELWIADRASGKGRRAFVETSSSWINLHDDLHFLPSGDRFLWLSERRGRRHLYLEGLEGEPAVALTSGDSALARAGGPAPWGGAVAWLEPESRTVLFHADLPSPLETNLYRVDLEGRGLARVTEGEGAHRVSFSPRGSYFIDEHSRAGVPPRLTLHRRDGSQLAVLTPAAAERLAAFALEPPRHFTVEADDGAELPARLLRPSPCKAGRRYPAIVYVYGGPGAPAIADRWDGRWFLYSQLLARRGYAVFTVDPRSASNQGKALEEAVARRFYGEVELKDILAGVRHLKSLPFIDPERVGIWGWSGGGTNTIYAMTRSQEFRAGIAVAGVADQRYYDTIYTERYMRRPSENEEGYRATAAAAAAERLHGRLLVVHGTADDNVHAQSALRLAHAFIAAGKQFDLMLYPGRDHAIHDAPARRHLYRLMLDFWDRWLKPAPDAEEGRGRKGKF